jgi:energy-coupling factor transport system ATP-binding protein
VNALALDRVSFGYGVGPVLREVSLRIGPGEGVALLGPNGAGKTTLTRLAMALLHPGSGRVETCGRDTRGRRPEQLADVVGYLFQNPESQLFAKTVRAEIAFGPVQRGRPEGETRAAVDAALADLGLEACADHHPYDLPVPVRRLVALGAALVGAPALLILDEPTTGLDRVSRARVVEVVRRRRASGTAVVAVTHDLGFAAAALDRAVVLGEGRVTRDQPLLDLLGHDPAFPAPPLLELARRLGLDGVRPGEAELAPHLTSPPGRRTLVE